MAKELLVKILLAQSTLYMFWIIETLYRLVYNFFSQDDTGSVVDSSYDKQKLVSRKDIKIYFISVYGMKYNGTWNQYPESYYI